MSERSTLCMNDGGLGATQPAMAPHLPRTTPDDGAWDDFVGQLEAGDVVQTEAWARAKEALGFQTGRAIARDESGAIIGGGLIVAKRMGPGRLGAVGYVARGPLVDPRHADRIDLVIDAVEKKARSMRVHHLVIQPPRGGEATLAALTARGYRPGGPDVAPTCTLMLDLEPGIEAAMARFSSSHRRNIRRAQTRGCVIRRGTLADLPAFQKLHAATAERQGFTPLSLDYLQQQWAALAPRGYLALFVGCAEETPDELIIGEWMTTFGRTVTNKISGWNGEHSARQPSLACIWHAIEWAAANGYRYFDFGGIDPAYADAIRKGEPPKSSKGERSPVAFKARFAADVVSMPGPVHFTFNPIVRPLVRLGYAKIADKAVFRRYVNGLRNG